MYPVLKLDMNLACKRSGPSRSPPPSRFDASPPSFLLANRPRASKRIHHPDNFHRSAKYHLSANDFRKTPALKKRFPRRRHDPQQVIFITARAFASVQIIVVVRIMEMRA